MKPKSKIKVGVIGENYENDAVAFCILLQKRPFDNTHFIALKTKGVTADNIESASAVGRRVIGEIAKEELKYVICMKDLDDTIDNTHKLAIKDAWFVTYKKVVGKQAICYLAIAETEALLLSDIETINKKYGTQIKQNANPINIVDPKKELQSKTEKSKNRYEPNHCGEIMQEIIFQKVFDNHKGERSFQAFIKELDGILK